MINSKFNTYGLTAKQGRSHVSIGGVHSPSWEDDHFLSGSLPFSPFFLSHSLGPIPTTILNPGGEFGAASG